MVAVVVAAQSEQWWHLFISASETLLTDVPIWTQHGMGVQAMLVVGATARGGPWVSAGTHAWRVFQRTVLGLIMQAMLVVGAAAPGAALEPWLCPARWGAAVRAAPTLERLRDCLAALETAVAPGRLASDYLRRPACVRGAWLPTRECTPRHLTAWVGKTVAGVTIRSSRVLMHQFSGNAASKPRSSPRAKSSGPLTEAAFLCRLSLRMSQRETCVMERLIPLAEAI